MRGGAVPPTEGRVVPPILLVARIRDLLMASAAALLTPEAVSSLPAETLAAILDQSVDCVKLIGLDGRLEYMNYNGQCAMEVEDLSVVLGRRWSELWPEETRQRIHAAWNSAVTGNAIRFDAFCPTAKGTPRWWNVSVSPIRDQRGAISGCISISRDITDAELTRQALETTTAEMRHRLKNSYAMVGSLLSGLARGTPDREAFAHEMIERLAALGSAQTLFASREHAPCRIEDLIPALVSAFKGMEGSMTIDALCDAVVDQGQADAIALVLGELAVNSAKHGALRHAGRIGLSVVETAGTITVLWSERSRNPIASRSRSGGQGLQLMERIVRARRGNLILEWFEAGLDARMMFPTPS
jgi:PAS domain S-box-containing protein